MPQAPMSIEMMRHAVMIVRKHGSVSRAAREEDIPYSTLQTRYAKAVQKGLTEADSEADPTHLELHNLRQRCEALEKQVRRQSEDEAFYHWVRNELFKMKESSPTPPGWVHSPGKMAKTSPGTPFLALGDWHAGETIDPDQIGGINEYNLSIFHKRAKRVVDTAVDLLEHHMVNPDYPGIVVALLGDMVSGDIHQELKETNELPTIPTVLDVCGVLQRSLEYLADRFGRVHVVGVVGNHGRSTIKPQAKNRTATSFDWLLYKMVEMQFQNDSRVTFQIPDSSEAKLRVHNHEYLIHHGDQFHGGEAMIGAMGPLLRGDYKKRLRESMLGDNYDTMICGHFHRLITLSQLIVNGSLVGYNEYAFNKNLPYEPPQQALWLTNPNYGITFTLPVYADEPKSRKPSEWIKVPS